MSIRVIDADIMVKYLPIIWYFEMRILYLYFYKKLVVDIIV